MEIFRPAQTTYWIATAGLAPVAGMTEPAMVTTFGTGWTVLLQTTDEAEWRAECERLGIEA
jgi:hypothetical protein